MGGSRAKALLAMTALVIVALVAGLTIWLTRDKDKPATAAVRYSQLFQQAVVGKTTVRVLDAWPKPPYQAYHDNNDNRCYEWDDTTAAVLYNLCFKHGKLASKSLA